MNIGITKRRTIIRTGVITASTALLATVLGAVFVAGTHSSWMTNSAYQNGYQQASYNFCNLKYTDQNDPFTDDIRSYEFVPKHTIVADAVCTDAQVLAWNEAQEDASSVERACKLDLSSSVFTVSLAMAPCVAPEQLN